MPRLLTQRWFLALGLALGMLSGCSLFGEDPPEEARLLVEGQAGGAARLIVSNNFLSQRQPITDADGFFVRDTVVVLLIEADTLAVTLPYDQTYDIRRHRQFYARVARTSAATEEMLARLLIDGEARAEERLTTGQDSLIMLYNYRDRPSRQDPDDV